MQKITVAIADNDDSRRAKFEHYLQDEQGIMVLRDGSKNKGEVTVERRLKPRTDISDIDNIVATIRRLNPRILFASMKQCTESDCALLVSLRSECPGTLVVMMADASSTPDDQVIQALASGARGYLDVGTDSPQFSKAAYVIDRGETWVPRKMLDKVMSKLLHWYHGGSIRNVLDTVG